MARTKITARIQTGIRCVEHACCCHACATVYFGEHASVITLRPQYTLTSALDPNLATFKAETRKGDGTHQLG